MHAEDRQLFRSLMKELGEPVPESWIVQTREELQQIIDSNPPWPLIIRPAYTLGGTGGGVAHDAGGARHFTADAVESVAKHAGFRRRHPGI